MAADESYLEHFEDASLISQITKLQAFIRGDFVRKQMAEIRQLYEEIVHDINGPDVEVVWPAGHLAHPTVRRAKNSTKRLKPEYSKDKSELYVRTESDHHPSARTRETTVSTEQHGRCETSVQVQEIQVEDLVPERDIQTSNVRQESTSASGLTWSNSNLVSVDVQTELDGDVVSVRSQNINEEQQHPPRSVCIEIQTDETELFGAKLVKKSAVETNITRSGLNGASLDSLPDIPTQPMASNSKHVEETVQPERIEDEESLRNDIEGKSQTISAAERVDGHKEQESNQHKLFQDIEKTAAELNEDKRVVNLELPDNRAELVQLKNTMAMELLWMQQAINSRKHYLHLKQQM